MIQENVANLGSMIQEAHKKLMTYDFDNGVTTNFMLGLTGSGKSALISYLLGAKIQHKKNKLMWEMKHNQPDKYPEIGNKFKSCTDMPSIFNDGEEYYLDLAGFMDTKGEAQEIMNAYINSKMFRRGSKTRILIVVEEGTLRAARGQNLVELTARIQNLFPANFSDVINCCQLVITKVNTDEYEIDDYRGSIQDIVQNNDCLTKETQDLLKFILNFNRLILFPQPRFNTPQVIDNIRQNIRNVKPYVLQFDAAISLSSKAKNILNDFSNNLILQISKWTKKIKEIIESEFNSQNYNDKNSLGKAIGKLKSAIRIMAVEYESGQLESFDNLCKQLSLQKSLAEKVGGFYQKMQFCKSLKPDLSIQTGLIQKLVSSMREALVDLQSKLQNITTREEIQNMNKIHRQNLEKRDKQFKIMIEKRQEDARQREERVRQEMAEYREHMAAQMKQQSREFQVFCEQMKEDAKEREERARQHQKQMFQNMMKIKEDARKSQERALQYQKQMYQNMREMKESARRSQERALQYQKQMYQNQIKVNHMQKDREMNEMKQQLQKNNQKTERIIGTLSKKQKKKFFNQ